MEGCHPACIICQSNTDWMDRRAEKYWSSKKNQHSVFFLQIILMLPLDHERLPGHHHPYVGLVFVCACCNPVITGPVPRSHHTWGLGEQIQKGFDSWVLHHQPKMCQKTVSVISYVRHRITAGAAVELTVTPSYRFAWQSHTTPLADAVDGI